MDERTETRWPTVRDQLQQLAAGAVTSVELTQRGLTAIAASQPTLNAFRVVLTESALAEASNADRRRAAGETGALLGVPIAVKDDVDIAGVPTMYNAFLAVPTAPELPSLRTCVSGGAALPVELAVAASPDPLPFLSLPAIQMTAAHTTRKIPTMAMVRPRPFMRFALFPCRTLAG